MNHMSINDVLDQLGRCSRIENDIALSKKRVGDETGYAYHNGRRDALRQFRDVCIDYMAGKAVINGAKLVG